MMKKPVGIQLWTVRDGLEKSIENTLKTIAEIGYRGIETWFPKYPAASELKRILQGTGLKAMGAHVPFLDLRDKFDQVAVYHQEIGNSDLAIPIIPENLRGTSENWKKRVEEIATIAERCRQAGFRLSYHNHTNEFEENVDGMEAHDYIFEQIDADLLKAELDTYFITAVGKDPVEYIKRYSGRVPLLHIKDQHKNKDKYQNTEIGSGTIDWDAVFRAAESAGVEWYVLEQNCEEYPSLQSIKTSFEFMQSKGIA